LAADYAEYFIARYFEWALRQVDDEAESFQRIGLVQDRVARSTITYLRALERHHRKAVMVAMIKRFHPQGLALSGQTLTPDENALLEEKDRAVFEIGLRTEKFHHRGLSAARFRTAFTARATQIGAFADNAKTGAKLELEVGSCRIRTVVAYNSDPVYNQVLLSSEGGYLYDGISVLSWLGVSGQSAWHLAERGSEEVAAEQMVKALELFVTATPTLLPAMP
jgi:hypothetical protein